MRVVGIDPGSHATGWGVVDFDGSRLIHVESRVIRAPGATLAGRLAHIHARLAEGISEVRPDAVALETVFTARNARSALLLGQARGVALAVCGLSGLSAAEYAPSQVKAAVAGYGSAPKLQVQGMVQRLLGLDAAPPSDAADALAVAICHGHVSRSLRLATLAELNAGPQRRVPRRRTRRTRR